MLRSLGILLFGLLLAEPVWALRCGHNLVVEGDYAYQVIKRCGEPDYKESRIEYRSVRMRGSGIQQPGVDFMQTVPVRLEQWTYDFGPNSLLQILLFEEGRLINIRAVENFE